MKSLFTGPDEDLPLKISAFFIFQRIPVGLLVFICVEVTPRECTQKQKLVGRQSTKWSLLFLLFLQAKLMMAKSKRGNHWTTSYLNLTHKMEKEDPTQQRWYLMTWERRWLKINKDTSTVHLEVMFPNSDFCLKYG